MKEMKEMFRHDVLAALSVAALVAVPAVAGAEVTPEELPDEAWISLSGQVVSTTPESFRLDYGSGLVTVEMDDFDFFQEGRLLMENDEVVVYGRIDDDLFETSKIEAHSVFVENLDTYFHASAADEESAATWTASRPIRPGEVEVLGFVKSVRDRSFIVDTAGGTVEVDVRYLGYDPLDDEGFLRIDQGDRVKVGGPLDTHFIDDGELDAEWIVEVAS